MYTTPLQLLEFFGDLEIAQLVAPKTSEVDGVLLRLTVEAGDRSSYVAEDIAAADKALVRLNGILIEAGHEVDSYIPPRYTLPLDQALIDGSALPRKSADIARYLLMDNLSTEEVEKRYDNAIKWLRDISMSKASLGEQDTGVVSQPGRTVARQGVSNTDWDTY